MRYVSLHCKGEFIDEIEVRDAISALSCALKIKVSYCLHRIDICDIIQDHTTNHMQHIPNSTEVWNAELPL